MIKASEITLILKRFTGKIFSRLFACCQREFASKRKLIFITLGIVVIPLILFIFRSETGTAKEPQIIFQEARQWQIAADAPATLTIRPNADGDPIGIETLVGAATHWQAVYEDPSEGDDNYVAVTSKNGNQYDLYNLDDTSQEGTINSITVHIRVRQDSSKAATAATVIKTGSTEARGAAYTLTGTYVPTSTVYTEKPAGAGGGAWTWGEIDSLQAGVEIIEGESDNGADLRCTQVWVVVDYIPFITVSGTVYSNEGVSGMASGRAVTVVVNGTNSYSTTTKADNSGDYWIGSIPEPSVNDVLTVFLDTDGGEKATTITKASSGDPIINLDLYEDRVIVRDQGSSADPITIEDMAYYDFDDDPDIQFTATTTEGTATTTTIFSGNKLYIWPGKTFDAGGEVIISGNASLSTLDGTLHIAEGSTLIACSPSTCTEGSDISLGGSWIASSSATFTHNNVTTTFTATTTGKNIWTEGSSDFYNIDFNGSGGGWEFTSNSATATNNFFITQGTATSSSEMLYVGGSWKVESGGTFLHNNATTTFNSADTGETINPGESLFYNVDFNNSNGGWTITNDATSTNNWFLTNAATSNGFIVNSNVRIEVKKQFSNQLPGTETTWTGSLLYLNSGTNYTVNSKIIGDIYETLQIGANTDVRIWNSTSSTYIVDGSGSLYSMDHDRDGNGTGDNGYLYIFGDYNISDSSTDYWSYATDFDGTDISDGSERQCHVKLAANSTTTVLSGKTLQVLGGSANTSTTINRQGDSGNYAIRTMEGATVNFQYYQIRNINSYGLNLTASTTVTSLNYGDFLLELEGATMITVSSSTIDQNVGLTITGSEFSSSTGAAAALGYNVTEIGTATSYWWFTGSIGNYDGEDYDLDPGGDPGYIRWDDSVTPTLTQWYHRWYDNANQLNPVNPLAATNTQATNATSGTVFRLRINIQIGSVQLDAGGQKFILQYASATDCSAVLESSWTEIGGLADDYTSVWRGYNNSTPNDGDTITSFLLVGKSDVFESYDETSPSVNNPNVIPVGQAGEWDWAIQYNAAYSSRTYCFRMAKDNGDPLDEYCDDIYPKIVTYQTATWKADEDASASVATGTDIRLRFQLINTGDATATDYKYQIEYALRSDDTCGDETFISMPILNTSSTSFFEMTTSSFFRYQDPTTHQLSSTSTYPFNTGQLVETYATTGDMDIGDVSLSEAEYVFHISTTTPEGYYCFRLTNNGAALDSYSVYGVLYVGTVGMNISGTIYPNEGGTPHNCAVTPLTVTAKVNGEGSDEGFCTESNGNYTISALTASAGDVITVFLNGDGLTETAVAVTKSINSNTNISGLDLYEDRVILRSDDGVALTIENMAQYDNSDDPDIKFTATTTDGTATTTTIFSGNKLYIWTNDSFSPGGEVKVLANQDSEPSGSLHIGTGAAFTACSPSTCTEGSDISVGGSWIASSSATFTHNDGTVTFKATATDKIIWIEGSSDFYNLTFNGLGGEWTFQDNATSTATTTITNGKVFQGTNNHLTFGGLYIETTGIFFEDTAGSGTLTFDRTADLDPAVIDDVAGTTGLGDVYIGLSPGVVNQNSDIVVDSLTVNVGDTHNTRGYEIDATSSITIYGTLDASDDKENDLTNIFLQTNWTNTGTFTHGDSTTTFDGGAENNTIAPGGSDFYTIVFDGSGGGWEFTSNSATATHDFFILQGTATSSSEMLYVGGSWKVESGGTFLHNNATTTFNSDDTGETINPGESLFYNVDFNNTEGGWTITNDATSTNNWFLTNAAVSDGFIVNSNVRIEVKKQFSNQLPGTETTWNSGSLLYLNSGTNYLANPKTVGDIYETLQIGVDTDIRMWNSTSSTYTVDSSGSLYSMDHDRDGSGAGDNGYLYIWGDYHIPAGTTDYWTHESDFDGTAAANRQVHVRLAANSTTTFDTGETLNATGTASASTTIDRQESGNYALKVEGGILNMEYYEIRNANENGLWLTASPTITSLDYGDYGLSVEGGTMMTVASTVIDNNTPFTITGCEFSTTSDLNTAYNVTEVGTPSNYWTFAGHYGNLDGEDYDNDPGDIPGYIRWDDSGITVSGIIYSNEGVSAFNCVGDNLTVKIELNGAGDYTDICTTGDGSYSMVIPVGAANDVLTAFIDGHGTFRAVTITKASSSDDNITGLDLYKNRVIVRHEDAPADPITIADMAYYDANDDADIKFTATTTDGTATTTTIFSGNKLYIWPQKTFNASGSIAILGNTGGEPDGSLHIADGATLTACPASECSAGNSITLSGSWIASSSATFTHNDIMVTFKATTTGKNIWTEGSSDFYDIVFNGSGGGWKFETNSATTTNDFTVTQGTVTSTSGILYVGGDWSNSGTFYHNSGTVLFNTTDEGHTIKDGGSAFYLINFNGSGGTWLYRDGASVSPATTTVVNGTSTFLNAKAGGVKVIGGYLLVDWYLGAHLIDASSTAINIDTDECYDITISEESASSTIWGYIEGTGWDGPYNSTTTGTGVACGGASGINPQPGSTTAIRIREYKKTATETFYYKYNFKVDWQTNYGEYDYYDDYGSNYLTSASSTQSSGVDKVISQSWYRNTSSTINSPYTCSAGSGNQCINQPPDNGSWYIGMRPGLLFEIVSGLNVDFGELKSSNNWTAKASSTLEVTTSASNGYVITAWAINEARMKLGNFDIYISKYDTKNDSPKEWDETCSPQNPDCCGFGFTTDDSSLSGGTDDRFTSGLDTCSGAVASGVEAYSGFATSTETVAFNPVADLSNPTTTDRTIITYKISVDSAQAAGQYQTTVVYICTANY